MAEWTPVDKQRLKDLWAAGWSSRRISFEFVGRTRNAIIGATHRLGLSSKIKRLEPQIITAKEPREPRRPTMPPTQPDMPLDGPVGPVQPIGFMDLANHHCRAVMIDHDPETGLAMSCGAPKYEDKSYCYRPHTLFT